MDSCVDRSTAISTRVRLFRLFLLIPCWESQRLIPKRSAGPRATKIGVVSLKALDHHRPNREESAVLPLRAHEKPGREDRGAPCRGRLRSTPPCDSAPRHPLYQHRLIGRTVKNDGSNAATGALWTLLLMCFRRWARIATHGRKCGRQVSGRPISEPGMNACCGVKFGIGGTHDRGPRPEAREGARCL